jgi:hypothetical protein
MKKYLWAAVLVLMAATGCKKEKTDTTAVFSISPDEVELRTS